MYRAARAEKEGRVGNDQEERRSYKLHVFIIYLCEALRERLWMSNAYVDEIALLVEDPGQLNKVLHPFACFSQSCEIEFVYGRSGTKNVVLACDLVLVKVDWFNAAEKFVKLDQTIALSVVERLRLAFLYVLDELLVTGEPAQVVLASIFVIDEVNWLAKIFTYLYHGAESPFSI